MGVVAAHNFDVWTYGKTNQPITAEDSKKVHDVISKNLQFDIAPYKETWYNTLSSFGMGVVEK